MMRFRKVVDEALMVVRQGTATTTEDLVFVSPTTSCEVFDIGDDDHTEPRLNRERDEEATAST